MDTKKIIKLYNDGMPATQIAKKVGVTNNKLYGHIGALIQKGLLVKRNHRKYSGTITSVTSRSRHKNVYDEDRWSQFQPTEKSVTLLDLKPHQCRFPCYGGLYCGEKTEEQYCDEHMKVAYAIK